MKNRTLYLLACILLTALLPVPPAGAQTMPLLQSDEQETLLSPSAFLGYELGTQWTPHHRVIDYVAHVGRLSPMVSVQQYGESYEGRELVLVTVSSTENMERIEEIRLDNLRRAGLEEGSPEENGTGIVWLSYNVHGNETSSSEAAMKTIWELVSPANSESKKWLENTVVIIDPMVNPDGRDRYVNWYRETAGSEMNPLVDSREHHEPWPGGRTNHYYHDLNRDWAWLTQKESRQRVAEYQRWMPQIHVDFHEQSYNDPYYFAPAAEPFHDAITDWQREFQYTIGRNHAEYFEENNWLYFTREVFDLFYPSYGDTYPIFNGAIGMTYEQGGHSRAGLGVVRAEGDTLTLMDRMNHHYTTGMSTIEVASAHNERMVEEFGRYFERSANDPEGRWKTFVIDGDNNRDRIMALFDLLDRHRIRYGKAPENRTVTGYSYTAGTQQRVEIDTDDYIISAWQPKSVMARILLEPRPLLVDSLTYDITAWEQHYAYGLEGYALEERIDPDLGAMMPAAPYTETADRPYAWLLRWDDLQDVRILAELLKNGITVRYATEPFTMDGETFSRGTLIITRTGNTRMGEAFDRKVRSVASRRQQKLYPVATGFVKSGSDFGSSSVRFLEKPRIALLTGEGTSSGSVGEIWHWFDRQISYPVTLLDTDYFNGIDLAEYDMLILPSGSYGNVLSDERLGEIRSWIRDGGKLVAVQGANRYLAGKEGFSLEQKSEEAPEDSSSALLRSWGERRRTDISRSNAGSIYRVDLDPTHPLGFGIGDHYFSLKLNADAYRYLESGWNVGVTRRDSHMSGFAGYKAKERIEETLTFGVQNMGSGSVVYLVDNPLFRSFWYSGSFLFGNAVFMVE